MRWLRRFSYWVRFGANERELRDEMSLHRDLLARDLERRGLTSSEADDQVARRMGNETYLREEARAVWLPPRLEVLAQDARYAWRGLRRSPVFTTVAVVSLALGIGANTAIFGLLHGLLFAKVAVPLPDQLVQPMRDVGAQGPDERLSHAEFDALAAGPVPLAMQASTFATLEVNGLGFTGNVEAESAQYFDVVRIHAQRGRVFSASESASRAPVVVVTDNFWHGRLNGDSAVVGRMVKVNGHPLTIIGVVPPGFEGLHFPSNVDLMMPYETATSLGIITERSPQQPMLTVFGRAAGSEPVARARTELGAIWARCCASGALVSAPPGWTVAPSTLAVRDISHGIPLPKLDVRGLYTRILIALMAGVGVLLLAACANVANLLLARSSTRLGELAVRRAMGASLGRLVAQLMVESLQLALLGAVVGTALAAWATRALARTSLGPLSAVIKPTLAPQVLLFTIVVSVISGLAFGLVPAVRVLRSDLVTPLKQSGRRAVRGRGVMDRGLVAVQVALALLLVTGAAMLAQTLRNLRDAALGFDPSQRFALMVETRHTAYERTGMTAQMTSELLRGALAIPGVRSAALAAQVPIYGGRNAADNVTVRGTALFAGGDAETIFVGVTPGYFATLGIPLLSGHDVGPPVATTGSAREVVINDLFASKFFPGRNPIGQVFEDGDQGSSAVTANRVVGVVGSAKFRNARQAALPMYFVPIADGDWPYLVLIVHSNVAATIEPALARVITSVAPGITQGNGVPLSASIDDALARERVAAALASVFGAIALGLVAVGLYGVMLYQVAERTMEIGIRVALGASRPSVVALMMRQSLAVLAIGLLGGVPLAIAASRAIASQLYGIAPYNVSGLMVATASLVFVVVLATLVPIRRALSINPLDALRAE